MKHPYINVCNEILNRSFKTYSALAGGVERKPTRFRELGTRKLFTMYEGEKFVSMSDGDREDLLRETHYRIVDLMNIPAFDFSIGKLEVHDFATAVCFMNKAKITVNEEILKENLEKAHHSKKERKTVGYDYLSIIIHETRHAYHAFMVNKLKTLLPMSNRDKHIALYNVIDDANRKVGEFVFDIRGDVTKNSYGDYRLVPSEFDARNYTLELLDKMVEEGVIEKNEVTKAFLNDMRIERLNDFDCIRNRGQKKSFDELEGISYYAKQINTNRLLLMQYDNSTAQFLSTVSETVNNEKYFEELVTYYNYHLEKVNEFEKTSEDNKSKSRDDGSSM